MNDKYPCDRCIVKPACTSRCDLYVNYYGRLIKSYARYGDRSKLMMSAEKQLPWDVILIFKSAIKKAVKKNHLIQLSYGHRSDNVYIFNTNGKLMKRDKE